MYYEEPMLDFAMVDDDEPEDDYGLFFITFEEPAS